MGINVTELREPNFEIDLPGEWEQAASEEDGAIEFAQVGGDRHMSVLLLAVRPVFAIADPERMLDDYMRHRSRFEEGKLPKLSQSEPEICGTQDALVGTWSAVDPGTGRRFKHHVVRDGGLLADFRYEADGLNEAVFTEEADAVFATARASEG